MHDAGTRAAFRQVGAVCTSWTSVWRPSDSFVEKKI